MPSREEVEALAQIFGDAKRMDNMWGERPVGMLGDSNVIKGEIENFARSQSPPQPQTQSIPVQQAPPQFQPPELDPVTGLPVDIAQELGSAATPFHNDSTVPFQDVVNQPIPTHYHNPIPTHGGGDSSALDSFDPNQMEFDFNLSEQKITNDYLKKITSNQDKILSVLTKLLKVLDKKDERVTKLQ